MTDVVQWSGTGAPASLEAEVAFRRMLWACDFSTSSLDALRWIIPIARAYQSEITALHVIPTTVPPPRRDAVHHQSRLAAASPAP